MIEKMTWRIPSRWRKRQTYQQRVYEVHQTQKVAVKLWEDKERGKEYGEGRMKRWWGKVSREVHSGWVLYSGTHKFTRSAIPYEGRVETSAPEQMLQHAYQKQLPFRGRAQLRRGVQVIIRWEVLLSRISSSSAGGTSTEIRTPCEPHQQKYNQQKQDVVH